MAPVGPALASVGVLRQPRRHLGMLGKLPHIEPFILHS